MNSGLWKPNLDAHLKELSSNLDQELVQREFPCIGDALYLNTGSCGRKPQSVLKALASGWEQLNENPTITTFMDPSPWQAARSVAARLLDVPERNLLLVQNSTQGLQLIMQSLLLRAGDELVTTDYEHGSVRVIARYLEETRGIVVRKHNVDAFEGSEALAKGILDLVTAKTKLVVVSEIFSYSGWRPDLSFLVEGLARRDVQLLVDGAHGPGQIKCRPARYPLWVGSGHKWLGGPNGTGFAYVSPDMVSRLEPVWLGDYFYEIKDADIQDLKRFESQGTSDVVRWRGVEAACELQFKLSSEKIIERSFDLVQYLRSKLEPLSPIYKTPEHTLEPHDSRTAMLAFRFDRKRVPVADLREELWSRYQIWVQPNFIDEIPGHGMRISCHYSLNEADLDRFVSALSKVLSGHE